MSLGLIYAPTAKMIKYANDLASQTGAALPQGYYQSYEVCHNFLDQNAPRKLDVQAREELRAIAPQIISSFLGEPNRRLSNSWQLRWHSKGSLALQLTGKYAGCWYDHASKAGGDIVDFIQAQHRCPIGQAIQLGFGFIGGAKSNSLPAPRKQIESEEDDAGRIVQALAIWDGTVPLHDSLAEGYLRQRGIEVHEGATLDVLRFHPSCPFGSRRAPALLALIQDIITGEPLGIHRRELTAKATSAGPPMSLGPKSGGVVKLSDTASGDLTIGEGIETSLAGMMLGFGPAWSALDAGGITGFPVLDHIRRLTILVDNDVSGTGQRAANECHERWMAAGKAVRRVTPEMAGEDINDVLLADLARSQQNA